MKAKNPGAKEYHGPFVWPKVNVSYNLPWLQRNSQQSCRCRYYLPTLIHTLTKYSATLHSMGRLTLQHWRVYNILQMLKKCQISLPHIPTALNIEKFLTLCKNPFIWVYAFWHIYLGMEIRIAMTRRKWSELNRIYYSPVLFFWKM